MPQIHSLLAVGFRGGETKKAPDLEIRPFLKSGISNSIDCTEEDELFSDFIGGRDIAEEEEECDLYNDGLPEKLFYELFEDSDNEDFVDF